MANNNLLTIDMITNKALQVLENSLVITRNVNRQYDDQFARNGAKIGDTLRIRLPDRALVTRGAALAIQADNQQYTTLTVSEQFQISVAFTSAEQTMKLDSFTDLVLKPRMSQMAAEIDTYVADAYKKIYNLVGTPGTTPSTSRVLTAAQTKLNNFAAAPHPRYATVNPDAEGELVEGMKGLFNPTDTISRQFSSGMVGTNIRGIDEVNMSQSIRMHTTGTRSTSDTILVNGTISTQGQSTISFDGGTGSATVTEGDVFTVAGVYSVNPQTRQSTGQLQQFVVLAASTASGGAWTNVSVSPAMYTSSNALATIDAFPQDGAAITFVGAANTAYPQNLVYHRDAITFATADLVLPTGGVIAAYRAQHNGISMRVIQDYDPLSDQMYCRLDVLAGFSVIRPEMAVRLIG